MPDVACLLGPEPPIEPEEDPDPCLNPEAPGKNIQGDGKPQGHAPRPGLSPKAAFPEWDRRTS